ncbi:pH-sensitive chloride channel 2-like [Rhodnius prolixus]|uniref:Putative ligand-gated ion channel n=1 Tax=Rhodnius prolixus TaxID=13249 RepID=R4G3D7_RHOPR
MKCKLGNLFLFLLTFGIAFTFDTSNWLINRVRRSDEPEQIPDELHYDKWTRPPSEDGNATTVYVRIYVYFLGAIEAQNLQYTAHILVRYRWLDPRLEHSKGVIEGEETLRNKIWTPHLYLVNEHDSTIMGTGKEDVLVSVQQDGTVLYSFRLKMTLLCLMDLQKFPFDDQKCPLVLESWGYNTSQLVLQWELSPISVNEELQLTEYTLVDSWTNRSTNGYSCKQKGCSTNRYNSKFSGNYSSLTVHFHLERAIGHYIMDYYVPSIFLVVVSWVSFWLDPNAVPGRTTLGTSTMLTFITLSRNIGSSLPKVSYIKATEYWFLLCTVFIFGSLVEFAFVNSIWRRKQTVEVKKKNSKYILKSTLTPQQKRKAYVRSEDRSVTSSTESVSPKQNRASMQTLSVTSISKDPLPYNLAFQEAQNSKKTSKGVFTMTPQEVAQWIDRRSRLFFPLAFLFFNCVYWIFVWL